jgi:hypothetical protein
MHESDGDSSPALAGTLERDGRGHSVERFEVLFVAGGVADAN